MDNTTHCARCGKPLSEFERAKIAGHGFLVTKAYCNPCGQALFRELTEGTPDPVDGEPVSGQTEGAGSGI